MGVSMLPLFLPPTPFSRSYKFTSTYPYITFKITQKWRNIELPRRCYEGWHPKNAPHPLLPPSPLGSWWPLVMGLVPPRPLRRLALVHDLSFSLISATFVVSLLIFTLSNTTSLLLDLISYS